jgi:hypothetical protein
LFLPRGDKCADFCFNGCSLKIKNVSDVTNSKAEHYIKVKDSAKINDIKQIFSNLELKKYSSIYGGHYWVSQCEIFIAYIEKIYGVDISTINHEEFMKNVLSCKIYDSKIFKLLQNLEL